MTDGQAQAQADEQPMVVLAVDTVSIQPYIFGSNRLRENVGASYLVAQATNVAPGSFALRALPTPHNVGSDGTIGRSTHVVPGGPLAAEVIYAGGGNVVLIARDVPVARAFTSALSRALLEEAPGLTIVIGRALYKRGDVLARKVGEALDAANRQKRAYAPSAQLLGLGVTTLCRSTRLPATGIARAVGSDEAAPVSAEILAKLDVMPKARCALRDTLPLDEPYTYPVELDHLGRSHGEASYIAVVHADGNGVGARIKGIAKRYDSAEQNFDYIAAMGAFSTALRRVSTAALYAVVGGLVEAVRADPKTGDRFVPYTVRDRFGANVEIGRVPLARARAADAAATDNDNEDGVVEQDRPFYLPFRPIVFGGDDVTFVCDGRLGLSLAIAYLREFERRAHAIADGPEDATPLSACAGVAIVKVAYPFARAYTLAEDLAQEAKKYRRDQSIAGSCLDWHVAATGLSGLIGEIRRREYETQDDGPLVLRPVTLADNPAPGQDARAWPVVLRGLHAFQGDAWRGRRNKAKALRDALRSGRHATVRFRAAFLDGEPLPPLDIRAHTGVDDDGWAGDRCAYFDALELADLDLPLQLTKED